MHYSDSFLDDERQLYMIPHPCIPSFWSAKQRVCFQAYRTPSLSRHLYQSCAGWLVAAFACDCSSLIVFRTTRPSGPRCSRSATLLEARTNASLQRSSEQQTMRHTLVYMPRACSQPSAQHICDQEQILRNADQGDKAPSPSRMNGWIKGLQTLTLA